MRSPLRRSSRLAILAGLACTTFAGAGGQAASDRVALEQFVQRTGEYVVLRNRAVARRPPLEETATPAEISAREAELATAIRAARAGAKPGDVFGSAGRPLTAMARREFRQRAPAERAALRSEHPPMAVPAVNEPYPSSLALATFPPPLLEAFPELPTELEYRFVGPHLILRDVEANLVVDVVPGVASP